jgi:L-asparagine transporter-like permease
LSLAEIAGVFVGFGALIAVRSGGPSEAFEVGYMRGLVSVGVLTVVAALAPVALAGYGLTTHEVWALSSLLVLVGYLVGFAIMAGTPEYQRNTRDWYRGAKGWRWWVTQVASWLFMAALLVALVIVMLGLFPDQEAALYFTVVVLSLLLAAWLLLYLVFAQRPSATASDLAEGPSA